MQMDIGMDTGMLEKVDLCLSAKNTTMGNLHDALQYAGSNLLIKVIDDILR